MAREVVWTGPGWDDLEAAASLGHFAERGQIVPEFGDESIRELLVKPYRLVYKLTDEHVDKVGSFNNAQ